VIDISSRYSCVHAWMRVLQMIRVHWLRHVTVRVRSHAQGPMPSSCPPYTPNAPLSTSQPCQAWWPPLVASARVARVAAEERGLQCSNMKDVKGYKLAMKDGESCWLQWAHLALLSTEAAVLNPCRRSFRYSFQPFQPTQPLQNNQQQVDPNSGRRGDLWSSFVNYRQSVIYCQSTRLCGAESFLGHKPLFIKDMWSSLVKRTLVKACIVLVYSIFTWVLPHATCKLRHYK
jgi:hypothetical protein